jgi:hypothetical protein
MLDTTADRNIVCPSDLCRAVLTLSLGAFLITFHADDTWSADVTIRCPKCNLEFLVEHNRVKFVGVHYKTLGE